MMHSTSGMKCHYGRGGGEGRTRELADPSPIPLIALLIHPLRHVTFLCFIPLLAYKTSVPGFLLCSIASAFSAIRSQTWANCCTNKTTAFRAQTHMARPNGTALSSLSPSCLLLAVVFSWPCCDVGNNRKL